MCLIEDINNLGEDDFPILPDIVLVTHPRSKIRSLLVPGRLSTPELFNSKLSELGRKESRYMKSTLEDIDAENLVACLQYGSSYVFELQYINSLDSDGGPITYFLVNTIPYSRFDLSDYSNLEIVKELSYDVLMKYFEEEPIIL